MYTYAQEHKYRLGGHLGSYAYGINIDQGGKLVPMPMV